jgi:hypothetical protein
VTEKPGTWTHQLDVVGLGFRMKRDARRTLADIIAKNGNIWGMQLVREPDNPADTNAIMVCLPKRLMGGAHIGYLRAPSAELLAPRIDRGSLAVVRATLLELRSENDFKEGTLDVTFRNKAQTRTAKGKISS